MALKFLGQGEVRPRRPDFPDADNTHPNAHDYEELSIIYDHLDTVTTVGLSADASAKPYKTTRKDGKRTSKITETYADGSKRFTFIVWAR